MKLKAVYEAQQTSPGSTINKISPVMFLDSE